MRKLFSLIAAVLFAGSMMAETYTRTAFADLQSGDAVIITMAKDANVYAASNDKGTSAAPVATAVTVANDAITTDATDIIWTVVKDGSNISFQTGDKFLYCTNSNNGVRVGTNDNKVFSIDATSGYLYNNATSRYIGVYNSADFRCYTSVNSNISGQTLAFYAKSAGPAPAVATPVITGDAVFFDSTIVTMTCATTDADIYYTTDGTTDPKCDCAAAPEYKKAIVLKATTTVKAAAYTGNDWSAVAEKTFTKAPSFASFEALVADGVADKTLIEVSFENLVITRFYESGGDNPQRKGIYFNVGEVEYEIYNSAAVVPEAWEVDGKVSGTIRGQWQHYVNQSKGIDIWEVVPMANGWAWTELTYEAPAAAGCDWDNIEFLGNGSGVEAYTNRFKICADPAPSSIVNIQSSFGTEPGIYVTFPGAAWGEISLPEDKYATQGAGMLLYVSAFLYDAETEVTIVNGEVTYTLTISNANPEEAPAQLVAVSEETTWNFSKITANTENALYGNDGIRLTDESTPSKNDEVIYAEYTSDFMTLDAAFDGASLAFKGEYPIRKNKYCQAGILHFKAAVAGSIEVKFSDTGSKASDSAVKRYLVVNGEQTEYWTSRENNGTDNPYAAQLDVVTEAIAVPAGDVTITGSSAIVVYYVTFTPSGATAISNTAAEAKAEKIMRNGMILIVKGDKTYNVMGQIVK